MTLNIIIATLFVMYILILPDIVIIKVFCYILHAVLGVSSLGPLCLHKPCPISHQPPQQPWTASSVSHFWNRNSLCADQL